MAEWSPEGDEMSTNASAAAPILQIAATMLAPNSAHSTAGSMAAPTRSDVRMVERGTSAAMITTAGENHNSARSGRPP